MLRQQPNLGEVNYWALSAGSFRALEMFLFKLHAPRPRFLEANRGVVTHFNEVLPLGHGQRDLGPVGMVEAGHAIPYHPHP